MKRVTQGMLAVCFHYRLYHRRLSESMKLDIKQFSFCRRGNLWLSYHLPGRVPFLCNNRVDMMAKGWRSGLSLLPHIKNLGPFCGEFVIDSGWMDDGQNFGN